MASTSICKSHWQQVLTDDLIVSVENAWVVIFDPRMLDILDSSLEGVDLRRQGVYLGTQGVDLGT
jgi:hypothetical protein